MLWKIFNFLFLFSIWFGGALVQLWRYDKGDLEKTGASRLGDEDRMSGEDVLFGVVGWPIILALYSIAIIISLPYQIPKYTYQWLKTD